MDSTHKFIFILGTALGIRYLNANITIGTVGFNAPEISLEDSLIFSNNYNQSRRTRSFYETFY